MPRYVAKIHTGPCNVAAEFLRLVYWGFKPEDIGRGTEHVYLFNQEAPDALDLEVRLHNLGYQGARVIEQWHNMKARW